MSIPVDIRHESRNCVNSKGEPTDMWDWDLWLEARGTAGLDDIARVVYSLPSLYPNPNRIIHDRASGFRLAIRSSNAQDETWGNIRVRLRLGWWGRLHMPMKGNQGPALQRHPAATAAYPMRGSTCSAARTIPQKTKLNESAWTMASRCFQEMTAIHPPVSITVPTAPR